MATKFKRGGTILIPYQGGWSISDSQGKPRMYKTMAAFEKAFPKHYLGTEGVELVEYAEVRHGRWEWKDGAAYCTAHKGKLSPHTYGYAYCPDCGAKMDGVGR